MPRIRKLFLIVIVASIGAGLLVRLFAISWNAPVMHGDVQMDASAAFSISRYARLLKFPEGDDGSRVERGEILAQHGPVWPVAGGLLSPVSIDAAYLNLRVLSFLSGIAILAALGALGIQLFGRGTAALAVAWSALSYQLIDYSGNGSFYSLQAALSLFWVYLAARMDRFRAVWLGGVSAVAYLLNFQAIILVPATVVILLTTGRRSWKVKLGQSCLAVGAAAFVASPWLIRNALLYGDPFYSHAVNQTYLFIKAGMGDIVTGEAVYPSLADWLRLLPTMIMSWIPNNLYYVARKLMVLAPVAFILFTYFLVDTLFDRERLRRLWPLVIFLAFQTAISVAWPVTKYRYIVVLLPFVFLLAAEKLWHLPGRPLWRRSLIVATFAGLFVVGFLTFHSVPTHTAYYDGAVTQDAFHGFEERTYLRAHGIIP